jgi:hypothetical protein
MMVYMVYHTLAFALHLIHCIGIWSYVAVSSRDRTSTTLFIDAASYLVGYEGRRHGICMAYALSFWIMHICLGFKLWEKH